MIDELDKTFSRSTVNLGFEQRLAECLFGLTRIAIALSILKKDELLPSNKKVENSKCRVLELPTGLVTQICNPGWVTRVMIFVPPWC
jgi:hypothetical protein